MDEARQSLHRELLEQNAPSVAEGLLLMLPTLWKPAYGIPYLWLAVGKLECCFLSSLKKKPIFDRFNTQEVDSVNLGDNNLKFLFKDFEHRPDLIVPISSEYQVEAQKAVELITKELR